MGSRLCSFCFLKSSGDEEAQLNDDEIMAHPYQSAEDLTARRPAHTGSNSNVAHRVDASEPVHPNGGGGQSSQEQSAAAAAEYQLDAKGDSDESALIRQFEQLDASQLQLKIESTPVLDYPFLSDGYTVSVIKRSRVLFLLRGASGSGKSTITSAIVAKYGSDVVVCSADNYFMQNGKYRFDANRLREAHEYSQSRGQTAAMSGKCVIVVDNTNIKRWETSAYVKLARENEYIVVEVIPKTAWRSNAVELSKRSRHGVPRDVIQRKLMEFEPLRVMYWGWFVNMEDSQLIRSQAEVFFVQCQTNMREFSNKLQTLGGFEPGAGPVTSSSYYRGQPSLPRSVHCTAFYSANKSPAQAAAYAGRDVVQRSIGQAFRLTVIGLYVTPRTLGVRLYMQQTQAELFEKSEASSPTATADGRLLDNSERAHLTLAVAQNHKPAETGHDQLELLRCEATQQPIETCMLNGASAKNFGQGRCVVLFDSPIEVDSLFSAVYASTSS